MNHNNITMDRKDVLGITHLLEWLNIQILGGIYQKIPIAGEDIYNENLPSLMEMQTDKAIWRKIGSYLQI